MAIKCRIWWDQNAQAYVVSTAYNKDLVTALKALIPAGDRDFDPVSKNWFLKEPYGEAIRQIAEKAFGVGSVSFTSKTVAQQASQRTYNQSQATVSTVSGTVEDAVVAFMNLVPYDAAKKSYQLAAMSLHPDRNQNDPQAGQKMARLNDLWQRVEKEFYKR